MPAQRTPRELSADMKSVKSIAYRKSLDGTAIVATNVFEEHNGRPLLLSLATLEDMIDLLTPEPDANAWVELAA